MSATQLTYFHAGKTTFVAKDISFFKDAFVVTEHEFRAAPRWLVPFSLVSQLFWLLFKGWSARIFVVQFAGYHTLLPALFGRLRNIPLLVVASGTESVSYPSINYGNFAKPAYRFFTASTFRLCSHIAVVHRSLVSSQNTYYSEDESDQGIFEHMPDLKIPTSEIPYGFDPGRWTLSQSMMPDSFITVAHIWNKMRYVLKGVDLMIEAALKLPDCTFTIVGMTYQPDIDIPANVNITPSAPNDALIELYQAHQYYVQLSISEGHPNAICEAMLCGCIPIGSAVAAIPDIIGEAGFLVERRSIEDVLLTFDRARQSDHAHLGTAARERIAQSYPIGRRRDSLIELAQSLIA